MKGAAGEEARATMSLRPSERAEVRRSCYKVAVDAEEDRRRREDNMVEIRKSRREESLLKKRRDGLPPSVAAAAPQMAHSSALQQKVCSPLALSLSFLPSSFPSLQVLLSLPVLTIHKRFPQPISSIQIRSRLHPHCLASSLPDVSPRATPTPSEWYKPGCLLEYPLGGSGAIIDDLVRGIEKFGGRLALCSHVENILIENGRAVGVKLRSGQVPGSVIWRWIRLFVPEDAAVAL